MKKIISVFIASIVLLSTISLCTITSFAEETTKYWEPRPNSQDAIGCVNGEPAEDMIYSVADEEYDACRTEYLGEGKVTGWEFPTLTEGVDYEIIKQYDNTIIVKFEYGAPYINALVDFSDEGDAAASVDPQSAADAIEPEIDLQNDDNVNSADDSNIVITEAPEDNTSNNTKTVLICVGAGVAVCLIAVFAVKKKKA